jgi:hypothetical protein
MIAYIVMVHGGSGGLPWYVIPLCFLAAGAIVALFLLACWWLNR